MKIAILGAECTGKSTLAGQLAAALQRPDRHAVCLPEALRLWCETHGRAPQAHEQPAIARAQTASLEQSSADVVISDTSAWMTAVYSEVYFGDPTLYADALPVQRRFDLTLVCGRDLPWVADGVQRDGPALQQRVDACLRQRLDQYQLPYSLVYGAGADRLACALQSIRHRLGEWPAADDALGRWAWTCEKCSDPACEHRLFRRLLQDPPPQ